MDTPFIGLYLGVTSAALPVLQEEIEATVASDPYVINGLIRGWSIKPYTVVLGSLPQA